MIGRIRGQMDSAFARPRFMRARLWRLAPEIGAGLVYLTLAVAWALLARSSTRPLVAAAAWAYMLSGVILVVVPAVAAAVALVGERGAGTLEALILLPGDRESLVWGRYWHVVAPWLRFILWMLPVYGVCILRFSPDLETGYDRAALTTTFCVFAPRPMLAATLLAQSEGNIGVLPEFHTVIVVLRLVRDVLSLLLATSMAYYLSARVRRPVTALVLAVVLVPLVLSTVFSLPEWVTLMLDRLTSSSSGRPPGQLPSLYFFWAVLALGLELTVSFRLVRSVAAKLDRFALSEP